jgi:hypothetical protein
MLLHPRDLNLHHLVGAASQNPPLSVFFQRLKTNDFIHPFKYERVRPNGAVCDS